MLKERYNFYKLDYKEYIIIIKSGNFYITLNDDAIILNKIFNYKIIESTNFIKIGFPLNSINKVIKQLDDKQINFIIVDKEIIEKQKYKNNKYNNYKIKYDIYEIYLNRINKINQMLKDNLTSSNINEIITNIESLLCKIN